MYRMEKDKQNIAEKNKRETKVRVRVDRKNYCGFLNFWRMCEKEKIKENEGDKYKKEKETKN